MVIFISYSLTTSSSSSILLPSLHINCGKLKKEKNMPATVVVDNEYVFYEVGKPVYLVKALRPDNGWFIVEVIYVLEENQSYKAGEQFSANQMNLAPPINR